MEYYLYAAEGIVIKWVANSARCYDNVAYVEEHRNSNNLTNSKISSLHKFRNTRLSEQI